MPTRNTKKTGGKVKKTARGKKAARVKKVTKVKTTVRVKKAVSKKRVSAKAKRSGARSAVKSRPRPKVPSVLILECDAEELDRQGLNIGSAVHEKILKWLPGLITSYLIRATSPDSLREEMQRCKEQHEFFDFILVVGHSSPRGIRLTPGNSVSWDVFSIWIETFEPKRLFLAACEAGQWLSAKSIFERVSKLKEIYASPVLMSKQQATGLMLLLFYFLAIKYPKNDLIQMIQSITLFRTGGLIYKWKRDECKDDGAAEGSQWDALAHLKEIFFRRGLNF